MVTIKVQPTCTGRTSATAYTGISHRKVGHIHVIADADANFFRIDRFGVEEKHRKTGVGRKLIEAMVAEVKRIGSSEIIVYPNPEAYADEELLDIETLYAIYEKLGFVFVNPDANRKRCDNKMIMHF